ncbi:MAG: hypothetical protein KJ941_05635 [Bacteroidetes bacterium]|nr:hypothetical protein [Bacteroidota bacterium]
MRKKSYFNDREAAPKAKRYWDCAVANPLSLRPIKKEVDIIQFYKKDKFFTKSEYDSSGRNEFFSWPESIASKTGFLEENTLFLNSNAHSNLNSKTIGLFVLQDHIEAPPRKRDLKEFYFFSPQTLRSNVELFELIKTGERYEVWFDGITNSFQIGIPKRDRFKLCNLEIGQSVEIKINGKHDFTMTGRSERTFREKQYLIKYVGKADSIEILAQNKIEKMKTLNVENLQKVDLRKILN